MFTSIIYCIEHMYFTFWSLVLVLVLFFLLWRQKCIVSFLLVSHWHPFNTLVIVKFTVIISRCIKLGSSSNNWISQLINIASIIDSYKHIITANNLYIARTLYSYLLLQSYYCFEPGVLQMHLKEAMFPSSKCFYYWDDFWCFSTFSCFFKPHPCPRNAQISQW